jgi:hypothetical protein
MIDIMSPHFIFYSSPALSITAGFRAKIPHEESAG